MNINDLVWVRLTPEGEKLWEKHWTKFPELSYTTIPEVIRKAQTEPNGWVHFSLWNLMEIFGEAMYIGNNRLPFVENEVRMEKP